MSGKVINIHHRTSYDVKIMRPGKWGNPFEIGRDGTREEVIRKYRKWIYAHPELLLAARRELRGKVLACCCKPLACHGDILLRIANGKRFKVQAAHVCHNPDCNTPCEPRFLMCYPCWRQVPRNLKAAVYRHYTPGQETGKVPIKPEWVTAARDAIRSVSSRARAIDPRHLRKVVEE